VNKEFNEFNAAMKQILKADPKTIKDQMEAEKKEREQKRKAKSSSASDHASGGED